MASSSMQNTESRPPDPPDRGGIEGKNDTTTVKANGGKHPTISVSFRDKVFGKHMVARKERTDILAENLARVELIKGNRLLPMYIPRSWKNFPLLGRIRWW
ncbi:hypothetical protein TSUD_397140 [Trifolium subterraneum]|uniref:Uncharacterized protein n=1 Tax=Trifolium subterraneum TaxID=3900 RepID=A0A2Z6NUM3_TRISU|nr:hypothetical protein TSUD_397140 [Trifolium subterraneum]